MPVEFCHINSRQSTLNSPSPVQRQRSMEAVRRIFNNWIQTTTLKLVTMFSCHGEYQTGLCVYVREKHKSQSSVMKAARLETQERAECIFSFFISPLFSPHPGVLSHFSHSRFFLFTTYLKGKMDCTAILSHTFLLHEHYYPHTLLPLISTFYTFFLSFGCPHFLPPSPYSSQSEGCMALSLLETPSHCKRMSLSQRKQSAFIMSYLPGPPWQQSRYPGRENVFGPLACRVKV